MDGLKERLDLILMSSVFDIGHASSRQGKPSRTYASRPEELVSVDHLHEMLADVGLSERGADAAKAALLRCPDDLLSQLVDCLRGVLVDYIDAERDLIGHSFPAVSNHGSTETHRLLSREMMAVSCITPLEVFARALMKGAALVGSDKIESLVAGWLKGHSIRYRTCAILNGVTINESLRPVPGVELVALPWSTDKLPSYLPSLSSIPSRDYLGRVVVAIDSQASPALFCPIADSWQNPVEPALGSVVGSEAVCQALSLESNGIVDIGFYWHDYMELADAFPPPETSIRYGRPGGLESHLQVGRSLSTDFNTGVVTLSVEDRLVLNPSPSELAATLGSLARPNFNAVRTATSRWMKSKYSHDGLVDQFVDIRMALETLYLHDFSNETQSRDAIPARTLRSLVLGRRPRGQKTYPENVERCL